MYKKIYKIGESEEEFKRIFLDPEYGWKSVEDFESDVCDLEEISDLYFGDIEEIEKVEGVPIRVFVVVVIKSRAYPEEIEAIQNEEGVFVDLDKYDWV